MIIKRADLKNSDDTSYSGLDQNDPLNPAYDLYT